MYTPICDKTKLTLLYVKIVGKKVWIFLACLPNQHLIKAPQSLVRLVGLVYSLFLSYNFQEHWYY